KHRLNHRISDGEGFTSWTPDMNIAYGFMDRYSGDYPVDERRESGIASAWVHEDHIRFVPKQYGTVGVDEVGPNEYAAEQEVIVAPNHNSELVTRRAAREMIGTDSKGFSSRPSNIDQLISARGEH